MTTRTGTGLHLAMVGPSSPAGLARFLEGSTADRARQTPGLGGTAVNNLVGALLERGVKIDLITLAPEVSEPLVLEGGALRILIGPYRPVARDRGRDLFRRERHHVRDLLSASRASVVHAQWTYEFALGALESSPARPTIVTARDAPFTMLRYMPDRYRVMRTVLAIMTRIRTSILAANSPYLAARWRRQMGYRRPIAILPNLVDDVAGEPPGDRGRDGDGPIILDVTDPGSRKNVSALIAAMGGVLSKFPAARCRLVGPGLTADSALAREAQAMPTGRSIDFVGPLFGAALDREYRNATIFIHSSLEESFGNTVAEAMSYGLPVVGGARAGAVPWVLGGGTAGVLVDMTRPAAISGAIVRLLADGGLRERLGSEARRQVRANFSADVVIPQALDLYEAVQRSP
jgi:L-malate glycosyltransferase